MSLAIDVDRVHSVLLADGWHLVTDFYLDAFELMEEGELMHCAGTGFSATCGEYTLSGPIASVLAVRYVEPTYFPGPNLP